MVDAVIPFLIAEGVGCVSLLSLFGPVEVPARYLMPRHKQLARHAHGHEPVLPVHDVQLHVVKGLADGHIVVKPVDLKRGGDHRAFGRAVQVENPQPLRRLEGHELFAAHGQVF